MDSESKSGKTGTRKLSFNAGGFYEGIRKSMPIVIGVIPFGMVFGVVARATGLGLIESLFMSAAVFAGSAQLVALTLWAFPLPILSIVLTTLLINLRLLLMGAALRPWFASLPAWQSYGSLLFLSDGGWALALKEFEDGGRNGAFILGSGFAQYVVWVAGTVVGFWAGSAIAEPTKWGLDFIVPASFLAIAVGMWSGKGDLLPWLAAAGAALLASILFEGNWFVIIGGLAGSLVGTFVGVSEETK